MKRRGNADSLEGVLDQVWAMLKRGVHRFYDPFHWPVLGTVGEDGCSQRSVILRQFRQPERILVCHTDSRAGKVQEISNTDRVSWHFYHPKKMVQVRITGPAELHSDDRFADGQWAATKITSRLNYCAVRAPGTPVDRPTSGLPDFLLNGVRAIQDSARGREHFTAISGRIESIDWLKLRVSGNRRARFEWEDDRLNATWLIP